jgi:hypothetical protein
LKFNLDRQKWVAETISWNGFYQAGVWENQMNFH